MGDLPPRPHAAGRDHRPAEEHRQRPQPRAHRQPPEPARARRPFAPLGLEQPRFHSGVRRASERWRCGDLGQHSADAMFDAVFSAGLRCRTWTSKLAPPSPARPIVRDGHCVAGSWRLCPADVAFCRRLPGSKAFHERCRPRSSRTQTLETDVLVTAATSSPLSPSSSNKDQGGPVLLVELVQDLVHDAARFFFSNSSRALGCSDGRSSLWAPSSAASPPLGCGDHRHQRR